MCFHAVFDNLCNFQIFNLPVQELADCKFICCVKYRWKCSTASPCLVSKCKPVEGIHIRLFKIKVSDTPEIHTFSRKKSSFRIIKCILDRQLHIRSTKLCNHCSVHILYHRMDHTLRLYNHLHIINIHIKKPSGFHHFQSFIDHGRRIDRNLTSHRPVRML